MSSITVSTTEQRDALPTSITILADIIQRNRISQANRSVGMIVYCTLENKAYKLVSGTGDTDWSEVFLPTGLIPLREVATRSATPVTRTLEGLECYVIDEETSFRLDGDLEWQEVVGGLSITGTDNQIVRLNGTDSIQGSDVTIDDDGTMRLTGNEPWLYLLGENEPWVELNGDYPSVQIQNDATDGTAWLLCSSNQSNSGASLYHNGSAITGDFMGVGKANTGVLEFYGASGSNGIIWSANDLAIGTYTAAPVKIGANNIVAINFDATTAFPTLPLGWTSAGTGAIIRSGGAAYYDNRNIYMEEDGSAVWAMLDANTSPSLQLATAAGSTNYQTYAAGAAGNQFGLAKADRTFLTSTGSAGLGIGTTDANPVIIGTADTARLTLGSTGGLTMDRTDSTASPGDAVINKMAGVSSIAAGQASVTITNSLVTTSSSVFAMLQASDGTLTQILRCVPGSGSFTITGNASATGNTRVAWFVTN